MYLTERGVVGGGVAVSVVVGRFCRHVWLECWSTLSAQEGGYRICVQSVALALGMFN